VPNNWSNWPVSRRGKGTAAAGFHTIEPGVQFFLSPAQGGHLVTKHHNILAQRIQHVAILRQCGLHDEDVVGQMIRPGC
jgi:hypothetical protein